MVGVFNYDTALIVAFMIVFVWIVTDKSAAEFEEVEILYGRDKEKGVDAALPECGLDTGMKSLCNWDSQKPMNNDYLLSVRFLEIYV